jgi:exopolysaccharide biosynthesis polyprenyl glycosylphosphotransferase
MLFSPSHKRRRLQLRISERRLLLMAGDAIAVVAAVLISLRVWAFVARYAFTPDFVLPQSHWFIILVGLWLLLASANDFYDLRTAARRLATLQRLLWITFQMLVVYLLVFFLSPPGSLPRLFILYFGVASFVLIAIWRLVNPALLGWASERRRVLIVGTDWAAEAIIGVIGRFAYSEYVIKGIIGEREDVGLSVCDVPVVGSGADLMNYVYRDGISELIITSTNELSGEVFQGVMDAYVRGVTIIPMPLLYERVTGRVPVEHVDSHWSVVLPIDGNSIFNPYPVLKRMADILLATFGLVISLVGLPLLVLLIWLDSPGSIFYTQERMGLNGRVFRIYKFRSMVPDAEQKTGAIFSQRGDPRVTRMGRLMRKTRLDELPQLLNILRGDMSLIGPRPERPEHVQRLTQKIPFYRTRLVVRPGLTGWAQVRYGYGSDDEDALIKLQYDLYYIRHQSFLLDMNILVRTIGRVLKMSGI